MESKQPQGYSLQVLKEGGVSRVHSDGMLVLQGLFCVKQSLSYIQVVHTHPNPQMLSMQAILNEQLYPSAAVVDESRGATRIAPSMNDLSSPTLYIAPLMLQSCLNDLSTRRNNGCSPLQKRNYKFKSYLQTIIYSVTKGRSPGFIQMYYYRRSFKR